MSRTGRNDAQLMKEWTFAERLVMMRCQLL